MKSCPYIPVDCFLISFTFAILAGGLYKIENAISPQEKTGTFKFYLVRKELFKSVEVNQEDRAAGSVLQRLRAGAKVSLEKSRTRFRMAKAKLTRSLQQRLNAYHGS